MTPEELARAVRELVPKIEVKVGSAATAARYSAIAPSKRSRRGAPAFHMRRRRDVTGDFLHAPAVRSSL